MAAPGRGGKTAPLGYQEAVSGDGERGVVVKAAPAAAFKVAQAEFLLQFLIVAFDDPALFGQRDQIAQLAVFRQIGHPVFRVPYRGSENPTALTGG